MEISVNVGDVVGVIKEQDPMGNKEKWFVDNGGKWLLIFILKVLKRK